MHVSKLDIIWIITTIIGMYFFIYAHILSILNSAQLKLHFIISFIDSSTKILAFPIMIHLLCVSRIVCMCVGPTIYGGCKMISLTIQHVYIHRNRTQIGPDNQRFCYFLFDPVCGGPTPSVFHLSEEIRRLHRIRLGP